MAIRIILALAVFLGGGAASADRLDHIATFEWSGDEVVGLSGLEVSADGARFVAIGDRGWYIAGAFGREDGQITGIVVDDYLPILGSNGWPVSARRAGDWSDAEGLAIAPNGTYWISFERWARVARFRAPDQPARWIKEHESFKDYPDNRQLEALAIHPDGSVITLPERPQRHGFPIYRLSNNSWDIIGHVPRRNRFAIVGADFDDAGRLYLLERKLVLGLWWQNRIRRLHLDAPEDAEVLWTGERGAFFNLEGIAVWSDEAGPRVTVVSDNNADPSEPTQFVEFRLIVTH